MIDYSKFELGRCEHIHANGGRCIQPAYVIAYTTGLTRDGNPPQPRKRHWCRKCHGRNHRTMKDPCPKCIANNEAKDHQAS